MHFLRTHFWRCCIVLAFFAILLVGVRAQAMSWYFQDETEHVAVGWVLIHFHRHMYTDLSSLHQPLPIFVGGILSRVVPAATFFELIDRLRISMWFFALIGSLAITLRFRWRGLIAVLLTYSLGQYFFAWHVLAEALVIPAVLWIGLALAEKGEKEPTKSSAEHLRDDVVFGFSTFWIAFCLLPLWPFTALASATYLWKIKSRQVHWFIAAILLPTLLLFCFINPLHWVQETIINNALYFIPFEAAHDRWHSVRLLFYPFLHFAFLSSLIARFYAMSVLVTLGALIYFRKTISWNRSTKLQFLTAGALVYALNPRVSIPNVSFYQGFHLFPYVAGLAVLFSVLFTEIVKDKKSRLWLGGGIVLLSILLLNNLPWVWEKKDKMSEYYIQYDTFQAYGTALKTISHSGNTLMTGPDGSGYMNMTAGLPFADRQNFHLEWSYRALYLRENWLTTMKSTPPTFLYYTLGEDSFSKLLQPILAEKYVVLRRKDGSPTQLMMLKSATADVSEEEWTKFEDQAFLKP